MQVGMSSKQHPLIAMSMTAYWRIRARLLRVPGVANVAIWGEKPQVLEVQTEPRRMQARGVTLRQVMSITGDALDAGLLRFATGSVVGTGGFLENASQRLPVHASLPLVGPHDLGPVPIAK